MSKHNCPKCSESYHTNGALIAHKQFAHSGRISGAKIKKQVKMDYLREELEYQGDATDLEEAKGGDTHASN